MICFKGPPFQEVMFTKEILKSVSALKWWRAEQKIFKNEKNMPILERLFTSFVSSAGVERVFSTFGLVQSKLILYFLKKS